MFRKKNGKQKNQSAGIPEEQQTIIRVRLQLEEQTDK
jgi:hypothetical protein